MRSLPALPFVAVLLVALISWALSDQPQAQVSDLRADGGHVQTLQKLLDGRLAKGGR